MHYIPVDFLDEVNAQLAQIETSDSKLTGRLEVYVCKSMGHHKRLYKELERQYKEQQQSSLISEPQEPNEINNHHEKTADKEEEPLEMEGPFGNMNDPNCRKTLFFLISVLNMAFPDYDFSNLKSQHFRRHRLVDIVQHVNSIMPGSADISGDLNRHHHIGGGGLHRSGLGNGGHFDDMNGDCERLKRRLWFAIEDAIGPHALDNIMSTAEPSAVVDPAVEPSSSANEESAGQFTAAVKRPRRNSYMTAPMSSLAEWEESEVEMYSYEPDNTSGAGDPFDETDEFVTESADGRRRVARGTIWRFFYFFYNRRVKRVLFFAMKADVVVSDEMGGGGGSGVIGSGMTNSEPASLYGLDDDRSSTSGSSDTCSPATQKTIIDSSLFKAEPVVYGHDIRISGGSGTSDYSRSLKRSLTDSQTP